MLNDMMRRWVTPPCPGTPEERMANYDRHQWVVNAVRDALIHATCAICGAGNWTNESCYPCEDVASGNLPPKELKEMPLRRSIR